MSEDGSVTIKRWEKKIEKMRDSGEKAQSDMKKVIAAAMRDDGTHTNIARELRDTTRAGYQIKPREGYGDDGEVITGFADDRPWTRD